MFFLIVNAKIKIDPDDNLRLEETLTLRYFSLSQFLFKIKITTIIAKKSFDGIIMLRFGETKVSKGFCGAKNPQNLGC